MTKAKFFYEKNLFSRLEISGHSGYAEYGSDIVCSGISSAVLTSINLIDKYTKNYQLEQDEDKGYLCFILNDLNDIKNNETLNNDEVMQNDSLLNSNDSEINLEENKNNISQISTLYSLTSDIEDSCDEFCELKSKILNAIAESENLSEKLQNRLNKTVIVKLNLV